MVEFYDINHWNVLLGVKPPKGSRSQLMFEHPETSDLYYFKKSHHNYKSEIWSEIIASKIGQAIGFNVLDYNLALKNGELGCLSKSMINTQNEETLYHGVDILSDFFNDFIISKKPTLSYQDIKKLCLDNQEFNTFLELFIEMILFDTLIGNTDRHTENWAFIENQKDPKIEIQPKNNAGCLAIISTLIGMGRSKNWTEKINKVQFHSPIVDIMIESKIMFSPIYDSGSCLGREINEERLNHFINDDKMIENYLNGGKSEIKWEDKNINFFLLIEYILEDNLDILIKCGKKIYDNLSPEKIQDIVKNADNCIENNKIESGLSKNRKLLIQTLLQKRLERINNILKF